MSKPDDAVIDEIIVGVISALRVSERSERAIKTLKHSLRWFATDAAAAPRQVEVTLKGTLTVDDFDSLKVTLPSGETIDLGEGVTETEGFQIKGLS